MSQPNDQWLSDHIDDDTHQEWIDALRSLVREEGKHHAKLLLDALDNEARVLGISQTKAPYSAYRNTIGLEDQPAYPGDLEVEERLTSIMRWNALAMVVRANKTYGGLGGHIASYASCAEIFELGFNHFFRARTEDFDGDLVYFQPHSAPGVYARAFLEGRLSEDDLKNYRQEVPGNGATIGVHAQLWELRERSSKVESGVESLAGFAEPIRETHHAGLIARHPATGQDQVESMTVPEHPRESHRATVDEGHPPAPAVDAEHRVAGGDTQIAEHGEFQPASDGVTLDRCDRRL